MSKVLFTGGSGLIGSYFLSRYKDSEYDIHNLTRSDVLVNSKNHRWDIESKFIADGALDDVKHIVHLSGAGIADERWSEYRKNEIMNSRVESANLLFDRISKLKQKPKTIISASAIGYYGAVTSEKIFIEEDPPGTDFQSEVCKVWEAGMNRFSNLNIRSVKLRFGIVLSPNGGALKKMLLPTKLGIGAPLGSGRQYFPWVHIEDVAKVIEKCLYDENMDGSYNVVAPQHLNYSEFASTLAKVLKKPFFAPNVPSFLLKILFGEMANIILEGSRVSSKKLIESGYEFRFKDLENALEDLLSVN